MVSFEGLTKVALVSTGAILGIIGANLLSTYLTSNTMLILGGAILFAIPCFMMGGDSGGEAFLRIVLGTAGLTTMARGVLTAAGLQAQLPAVVAAVI